MVLVNFYVNIGLLKYNVENSVHDMIVRDSYDEGIMMHMWFLFICFVMIMMLYAHDGYDMHRNYDVMI